MKKWKISFKVYGHSTSLEMRNWTKEDIACELWKDPETLISDTTLVAVRSAHAYLESFGYEMAGVRSDGDCFMHSFLGSYQNILREIPILDQQMNPLQYLRELISIAIRDRDLTRGEEVMRQGTWISSKEGELLTKILDIPMRIVTVNVDNEDHSFGINDMMCTKQSNGELESSEWNAGISNQPQSFIFIVDLGKHFVYARKLSEKASQPSFSTKQEMEIVDKLPLCSSPDHQNSCNNTMEKETSTIVVPSGYINRKLMKQKKARSKDNISVNSDKRIRYMWGEQKPYTGQIVICDIASIAIDIISRSVILGKHGGSTLNSVYAVERFLYLLCQAGWKIRIAELISVKEFVPFVDYLVLMHTQAVICHILQFPEYICKLEDLQNAPLIIAAHLENTTMIEDKLRVYSNIGCRTVLANGMYIKNTNMIGFELIFKRNLASIESTDFLDRALRKTCVGDALKMWTIASRLLPSSPASIIAAAIVISKLLPQSFHGAIDMDYVRYFTLHCVLSRSLSVEDRCFRDPSIDITANPILEICSKLYLRVLSKIPAGLCDSSIGDVYDGRLFATLIGLMQRKDITTLPADIIQETENLWAASCKLANITESPTLQSTRVPCEGHLKNPVYQDRMKMELSVTDSVMLKKLLPQLETELESEKSQDSSDSSAGGSKDEDKIVHNEYHCHSKKQLPDERKRTTRKGGSLWLDQKLATFIKRLSESQNFRASNVNQIVLARSDCQFSCLVAEDKNTSKHKDSPPRSSQGSKPKQTQKGNKKNAGKISNKDQIRASVAASTLQKEHTKINTDLNRLSAGEKGKQKLVSLGQLLRKYSKKHYMKESLAVLSFSLANWCADEWKNSCDDKKFPRDFELAVFTFRVSVDTLELYVSYLDENQINVLLNHFHMLGFPEISANFEKWIAQKQGKPVKLSIIKTKNSYKVGFSSQLFQLQYCGHLMQRGLDSASDPRVDFDPDKWQRSLLDCVDKGNSALVVAPTSSGKTFVSFYVMEKVLKDRMTTKAKKRDLVVYAAPTVVLVNQMWSVVAARLPEASIGIFTRDYRIQDEDCDVLITVVECLELLLLNAGWGRRLKYVILDEVHCIGTVTEESSPSWERVICLLHCPFIALSATVGNPNEFHCWLQELQSRYNKKVELIHHDYRWADLKMHLFSDELIDLHPMACLANYNTWDYNQVKGIPSLSPAETQCLYDILSKLQHECLWIKDKLKSFDPCVWFHSAQIIRRDDVYKYSFELREFVIACEKECLHERNCMHTVIAKLPGAEELKYLLRDPISITELCFRLKRENYTPAILFNLSRQKCELLTALVYKRLRQMEKKDPALINQRNQAAAAEKQFEKAQKHKTLQTMLGNTKGMSEKEISENIEEYTNSFQPKFCAAEYAYSFIPEGKHWNDEAEWWLKRSLGKCPRLEGLIRGLRKGIAVHHAGLEKPYREAVEVLLRAGIIGIVFATGTLALGLNVPCRTVVIVEDSPFLNPLLFRQMIGRAGRRGYDDYGNVVFANINVRRICDLITAPLDPLRTFMPINTGVVLRSCMYFNDSTLGDQKEVLKRLDGLLNYQMLPFMEKVAGRQNLADMFARRSTILFRAYFELLRKLRLLNSSGAPIGLARIVSHLHYHEPANLIMVSLLRHPALVSLCQQQVHSNHEDTARNLLIFLSHFFNVLPLPPGKDNPELYKESSSNVILPNLTGELKAALDDFDNQTLHVMKQFFSSYCAAFHKKFPFERQSLPLSRLNFGGTLKLDSIEKDEDSLLSDLSRARGSCNLRSPFVGLGGLLDDICFGSARELVESLPVEFGICINHIPCRNLRRTSGHKVAINSAALDLFKHGQWGLLSQVHFLKSGHDYKYIQDWNLLLKSIYKELELDVESIDNRVIAAFKYLTEQFSLRFKKSIEDYDASKKNITIF